MLKRWQAVCNNVSAVNWLGQDLNCKSPVYTKHARFLYLSLNKGEGGDYYKHFNYMFQFRCWKRLSIKEVRSQGGESFLQCVHFLEKWGGGFLKCERQHFFVKTSGFPIFVLCPHGQRGEDRTSADICRQGGLILRTFVRTFFMDAMRLMV